MADITVEVHNGILKTYEDRGDGTHAEVMALSAPTIAALATAIAAALGSGATVSSTPTGALLLDGLPILVDGLPLVIA